MKGEILWQFQIFYGFRLLTHLIFVFWEIFFRVWFVLVHQMVSPLHDPFSVECLSFHKISPFNITRLLNGILCLGFMFCAPNSTFGRFVLLSCCVDETFKTVRV